MLITASAAHKDRIEEGPGRARCVADETTQHWFRACVVWAALRPSRSKIGREIVAAEPMAGPFQKLRELVQRVGQLRDEAGELMTEDRKDEDGEQERARR